MDMFKKPYEISLWDEQLVWHRRKLEQVNVEENKYERGVYYSEKKDALGTAIYELNNQEYDSNTIYYQLTSLEEGNYIEGFSADEIIMPESWRGIPQVIISFYQEVFVCVIGSNTMASMARCVNPKLTSKISGENTLTFTMYHKYIDTETGQLQKNPYQIYMTNERKIKLRVGDISNPKWYDFVIKQIQENSETCAFTYTCKDQFINELSKTGFEIELDNELENNMGTVETLAENILKGSDWRVGKSDKLRQYIEEPLYEITLALPIKAVDMITGEKTLSLSPGYKIYAFYSIINDQKPDLQFLYTRNSQFNCNSDMLIDKDLHSNYIIKNVQYNSEGKPSFADSIKISTKFRGCRLVQQIQTKYDSTIDKFVQVYNKNGQTYYGFAETEFISPAIVKNYIVNPSAFTNVTGWEMEKKNGILPSLELVIDPPVQKENIGENFTSYLKFSNNGAKLKNSSINSFKSDLSNFVEDKTEYVFRIKYKIGNASGTYARIAPTVVIGSYEITSDDSFEIEPIFNFDPNTASLDNSGYLSMTATARKSISQAELQEWENKYGLFLEFQDLNEIFIEEVQLFPLFMHEGNMCVPDGEFFTESRIVYKYYVPNSQWTSIKDLEVASVSINAKDPTYEPVFLDGADAFTKIAGITAKESNRFNLIQTLNEKFECWSRFEIEHNPATGAILLGKDKGIVIGNEAYRQQKFVSFHEYASDKYNWAGFRYGVNSKSIQRVIDSNAIISKLVVKNNANEFAQNGFCSIARAAENPIKENFLMDFDYYAQHRLLNINIVTNDLYLDSNGYLGYYKKLKRLNAGREQAIEQQANLLLDISKYEASYQSYKLSYDAAYEKRIGIEMEMRRLVGASENADFAEILEKGEQDNWSGREKFESYKASWAQCKNIENTHKPLYEKAKGYLDSAQQDYNRITAELKELTEQKRALNIQFYKKYSRFIQEGSWIKEDYIDDNLYYLDSLSTLHASAQPKVTYTINVLDLSQLPGYEGYTFELGDRTYIEDIEFFGWSLADSSTPYREEIIVTELTQELDSPEKNVIKVQNYKTQFEDLFQRITAQTQQAEYHTGEYKRAAQAIEPNGAISLTTLENSFANNSLKLQNVKDQSVVIDEYGITSTSLANPNEMVRIVAGGIFMSTDGGATWKTGLTGYGLNSSYLTAGQINADEIYIMSGSQPAFRWDEKGLNAYYCTKNQDIITYNLGKYVRFDHFGIYGVDKEADWSAETIEEVHQEARFALTWKGFSLKNKYGNGYVSIDSENDFIVHDGTYARIKIGKIGELDTAPIYGIQIGDGFGNTVMQTDSNGELWLQNRLRIGDGQTSSVEIGYIDKKAGEEKHKVIHAGFSKDDDNDKEFIVYEDGHVIANYIEAKAGKIGNMTIEQVEQSKYEVLITSSRGNALKEGSQTILTAQLLLAGKPYEGTVGYQWYKVNNGNIENIQGETKSILTIDSVVFNDGYVQYGCKIIMG